MPTMHHHSIASLLLASANVFSLAIAQASSASADLGDLLIDSGASVGVVSGTATATATSEPVVTQTVTSSQTSPQSQESASPNDGDSSEYGDEQLYAACFPGIFNNQTDWTAPCPAMQAIEGQCTWGPDALDAVKRVIASQGSDRGTIDETWEMQPPELMRACICSSQYVDMLLGCGACLAGYGLRQSSVRRLGFTSNATIMSEWSKLYCDASKTPNEDSFSDAYEIISGEAEDSDDASDSSSRSSIATASISKATAVSIYFTPSVSSAYIVALPTASSSANQTHPNAWYTYSSLSTSDGQIVPTAVAAKASGGGGGGSSESGDSTVSGGSTTAKAAGAMQTAMVGAGAIGAAVFALAL
jgi:hypothetical protein